MLRDKQGKGTFFDPDIVDAFLEIEAEFEATFDRYNLEESKPAVMEKEAK